MFLVSGVELVCATSQAGLLGTFPTLNARTTQVLDQWLEPFEALAEAEAKRLDAEYPQERLVALANAGGVEA